MSKALKTAAIIVGAVALVATGVGAAAGLGAFGSVAAGTMSVATAATLATVSTIATIAGAAAGVLSLAAGLTATKPSAQATGSQTQFSADPDAGIPYVIGRTGTAGNIVFRKGFDTSAAGDNDRQSFVSVLSLGPVKSAGGFTVDKAPVSFSGVGAALGTFAGFMWMTTQLGLLPEASAMGFGTGAGSPPGWVSTSKLSGLAAATWTLRFDTKAKLFQNGVPAPMWVVEGGLCYDPRKDSTYPGGSGSHRMADPADRAAYDAAVATWEYSENPYLHGLKWAHGIWQRDKTNPTSDWQRVMGMGAPQAAIDVAAFVEGANIADANGWKVGGVVFSGDAKWDSFKKILQAGMGEPLTLGAKISCLVNTPRVSLATITINDVIGEASVAATQPRRNRINTITPRYRLEANNWELLPGPPITVSEYVTADRGKRSKVQDYPFIQDSKQVATAVRYDIENAREFGPIVLPLRLAWMGYRPGDCVTAQLPELGLNGQTILLLNRELQPATGVVTMTARSETAGKHPFALGQTTTPPPTPGVTGAPVVPVPGATAWTISATKLIGAGGAELPALVVTGAADAGSPEAVIFEYRAFVSGQADDTGWIAAGVEPAAVTRKEIASLAPGGQYEVAVSYRVRGVVGTRRILGPSTIGILTGQPGADGQGTTTLINKANMTIAGGTVTKTGGTAGVWDASVHSAEGYVGDVMAMGQVVNATGTHIMIGLTTDPEADESYYSIDFAAYNTVGALATYENGVHADAGTVSNGDFIYARRRGTTIEYGVLGEAAPRYSHGGVSATTKLYLDTSFYEVGAQLKSVQLMPLGADGRNAITGYLTNETHLLPADASGAITSYAGATGTFRVLYGSLDITTSCGFALAPGGNPQTLVKDGSEGIIASTTGVYTINGGFDAGEPSASATFRATIPSIYGGGTIDKTFSLGKSKAGANGTPPPLITLEASTQTAKYDKDDVYVGGPIQLTATRQNASDTTNWTLLKADGSTIFTGSAAAFVAASPTYWSSSDGDHLTISALGVADNLAYHGYPISLHATANGVSDQTSIQKVKDGANGISTATIEVYQRAASTPALPSATVTYDFAAKTLTGLNNGWSRTWPTTGTDPVYVTAATFAAAAATDTAAPSEWAAAAIAAANGGPGATGVTVAPVLLYNRTSTPAAPAVPSTTTTFNFGTAVASGMNNGWAQSLPPTGGAYRWQINATAAATGSSDTIAPSEWSAPAISAQDGADGTPGTSPIVATLSAYSIPVQADYTGVTKTGQLPKSSKLVVSQGTTVITGSVSVSLNYSDSGAIAADYAVVDGNYVVIVTTADASGWVDVVMAYSGWTDTKRIQIVRGQDAAPAESQTSAAANINMSASATTYDGSGAGGSLKLRANASGVIHSSYSGAYDPPVYGGATVSNIIVAGRMEYSPTGAGSWSAGTETLGTKASWDKVDVVEGSISIGATFSGLTPGAAYDIRPNVRKSSGTTGGTVVSGNLSVSQ